MKTCSRKQAVKPTRSRGQGLVELSLAFPILMLVLLGTIEVGRLIYIYSAVTTASREATRYGFSLGDNGWGIPRYQDCAGILEAAKAPTSIAGIEAANIEITYDSGPGTEIISYCPPPSVANGYRIVIRVTSTFQSITPLVQLPEIVISSTSKRTILVGQEVYE